LGGAPRGVRIPIVSEEWKEKGGDIEEMKAQKKGKEKKKQRETSGKRNP